MSGRQHHPRYADVVGTLALLVAMSGTAYAAHALPRNSVGTKQIKDNKVTSKDLKNSGVGAADLAAGSVGPAAVGANAISTTASVKDHTLTLVDLEGVDQTSAINGTVPANSCADGIVFVTGAQLGQFVMVGLAGAVAVPDVTFTPARVEVANQVAFGICNPTTSSVNLGNVDVRVVTFG